MTACVAAMNFVESVQLWGAASAERPTIPRTSRRLKTFMHMQQIFNPEPALPTVDLAQRIGIGQDFCELCEDPHFTSTLQIEPRPRPTNVLGPVYRSLYILGLCLQEPLCVGASV